jgi:DNA-binding response OmpR family regulator
VRVLIVESDSGVGAVVEGILVDAGHTAVVLTNARPEAVLATVERHEPDCVLLDGGSRVAYDTSWDVAAWLRSRPRPVPTVMFTVHTDAIIEVRTGLTARSRDFAAVLSKPFELDDLLATVAAVTTTA